MSEMAKSARAAMKKKIARITADPHQKVDASSWTPPEALNTDKMTGLRPISRQHRKAGGKVVGAKAAKRADKKARATGGRSVADEYVNRNVKKANAAEFGKPHEGGYKRGGKAKRTGKDAGGALGDVGDFILGGGLAGMAAKKLFAGKGGSGNAATPPSVADMGKKRGGSAGNYTGGTRPTGGRIARKDGGRAKGKTNINIIIGAGGQKQPEMPPSQMMPARPPQAVPVPPPQAAPMPPPMPGAGAGLPPPPMQRKSGGRVGNRRYRSFKDMDAGAGGGLGRLEKTEIQENK